MRLLRTAKLDELLGQVSKNLDLYRSGNFSFLEIDPSNYFKVENQIDMGKITSIDCTEKDRNEINNCIDMFQAFQDLSPYLARDERLWVYMTHTKLLEYTRKRWPIPNDNEKAVTHIRNHFFVIGARGFERDNSASRLWWLASLCNRVQGLSLADALSCLLYQSDVRANIIERPTTSQSIHVFSAIIKKLHSSYTGDKKLFERNLFRTVMKDLNLVGGIKLLEAMQESEIDKILSESIVVV